MGTFDRIPSLREEYIADVRFTTVFGSKRIINGNCINSTRITEDNEVPKLPESWFRLLGAFTLPFSVHVYEGAYEIKARESKSQRDINIQYVYFLS